MKKRIRNHSQTSRIVRRIPKSRWASSSTSSSTTSTTSSIRWMPRIRRSVSSTGARFNYLVSNKQYNGLIKIRFYFSTKSTAHKEKKTICSYEIWKTVRQTSINKVVNPPVLSVGTRPGLFCPVSNSQTQNKTKTKIL